MAAARGWGRVSEEGARGAALPRARSCRLAGRVSSGDLLTNMAPTVNDSVLCTSKCVERVDFMLCSSHQIDRRKRKSRRGLWGVMDPLTTLTVAMVLKAIESYARVMSGMGTSNLCLDLSVRHKIQERDALLG